MSKFDSIWTEEQARQAAAEGWQLCITVDEGKPMSTAYLFIFDHGPRFMNRNQAYQHVMAQAYGGSKLHIEALSACSASRAGDATRKRRR